MYTFINTRSSIFVSIAAMAFVGLLAGTAYGSPNSTHAVAKRAAHHHSRRGPSGGVVYGAVSAEGLPVVIEVSRDGLEVVKMAMAVPVHCEPSGISFLVPANFEHVPIKASGTFKDGVEGSSGETSLKGTVTGSFNNSMTAVSSTWNVTLTNSSSTGTDTCNSGAVTVDAAL